MYDSVVIVNGYPPMSATNFKLANNAKCHSLQRWLINWVTMYHFLGLNVSNCLHYFIVHRVFVGGQLDHILHKFLGHLSRFWWFYLSIDEYIVTHYQNKSHFIHFWWQNPIRVRFSITTQFAPAYFPIWFTLQCSVLFDTRNMI